MNKILLTASILILSLSISAQKVTSYEIKDISKNELATTLPADINTHNHRLVKIDINKLQNIAKTVDFEINNTDKGTEIEFPHPDGTNHTYKLVRNTTMHPDLAAKFPLISTYNAIGISHPGEQGKIDITQKGLHAMINSTKQSTIFIDPYNRETTEDYLVYSRNDMEEEKEFSCDVVSQTSEPNLSNNSSLASFGTCELRTYRIAVAGNEEYTNFHGSKANAIAAQVTTINRVNQVYEKTLAITFEIIANNDLLVFEWDGLADSDPSHVDDGYTNGNAVQMLSNNGSIINSALSAVGGGSGSYDIGHVFATSGAGLAGLEVVCTGSKAQGVTGIGSPVGDPFDVDYVCHEIGHQFGGRHTQNNVGCNSDFPSSVEPGSGSTIMGYAGVCSPSVANNSHDNFNGNSIQEIGNFITSTSCASKSSLTNNAPNIVSTTSSNIHIPSGTPFILRGTATDTDANDVLSYQWDQMNPEASDQPPVSSSTKGPNFRSYSPTEDSLRFIPNLDDLRQSQGKGTTWEMLSDVTRTLKFRLMVYDNHSLGSCNDHKDINVKVDGNTGPFQITYPAELGLSLLRGAEETIIWDVAGTDAGLINCGEVDIVLSVDGGITYTDTLAQNVANDGEHTITVPNEPATSCRVMVVCSDHTFFNISPRGFSISQNSVGVNEIQNNSFKAYPNPTTETLNFYLKEVKETQINIVDVTGKLVYTDLINTQKSNINTSNFKKGMYFVQFKNETSSHTVKIIKE